MKKLQKQRKKIGSAILMMAGCCVFFGGQIVFAEAFVGTDIYNPQLDGNLSRGEATQMAVKYFDIENKNRKFLTECDVQPDQCLFTFSARTTFKDFRIKPIILYPDVYPAHQYYKSINIASKLDLVRGYFDEENSPFKPEQKITKIEALKLALGASGSLAWKDKFEFDIDSAGQAEKLGWLSLDKWGGDKWWYARYLFNAINKGVLTTVTGFDPNAKVSNAEFQKMLESSSKMISSGQVK